MDGAHPRIVAKSTTAGFTLLDNTYVLSHCHAIKITKRAKLVENKQVLPVKFQGSGSEYFRIWIVNILLTILTLGIYSAWAKVRRNQYLYSCTQIDGSSFEYHGNPIAILKGRIAAVILIGGYNLALSRSFTVAMVILAVMAVVMPWMLWRSLQFRLHNTSYRGIRFGFDGSAGGAYKTFLAYPALAAFTLWIFFGPLMHQRIKRFQHTESRFGTRHFSFSATAGDFYTVYYAFGIPALLILFGIGYAFFPGKGLMDPETMNTFGTVMIALYLLTLVAGSVFMAMMQNLVWNHTHLGEHSFESNVQWSRMAFITVTNLIGIVCTLGLFTPFATIRALKYRLESASMIAASPLDDFVAATGDEVNATGDGMADLLDFDLSM
jgi:uncharacterized membrane protein YjgN (DUF898 family)